MKSMKVHEINESSWKQ